MYVESILCVSLVQNEYNEIFFLKCLPDICFSYKIFINVNNCFCFVAEKLYASLKVVKVRFWFCEGNHLIKFACIVDLIALFVILLFSQKGQLMNFLGKGMNLLNYHKLVWAKCAALGHCSRPKCGHLIFVFFFPSSTIIILLSEGVVLGEILYEEQGPPLWAEI